MAGWLEGLDWAGREDRPRRRAAENAVKGRGFIMWL